MDSLTIKKLHLLADTLERITTQRDRQGDYVAAIDIDLELLNITGRLRAIASTLTYKNWVEAA